VETSVNSASKQVAPAKYAFKTEYENKSSFAEGSNLEEIKASIARSYGLEDGNMHLQIKTGPESFSQLDSQDAMSGYLHVIGYSKDHIIIVEHKAEARTDEAEVETSKAKRQCCWFISILLCLIIPTIIIIIIAGSGSSNPDDNSVAASTPPTIAPEMEPSTPTN